MTIHRDVQSARPNSNISAGNFHGQDNTLQRQRNGREIRSEKKARYTCRVQSPPIQVEPVAFDTNWATGPQGHVLVSSRYQMHHEYPGRSSLPQNPNPNQLYPDERHSPRHHCPFMCYRASVSLFPYRLTWMYRHTQPRCPEAPKTRHLLC